MGTLARDGLIIMESFRLDSFLTHISRGVAFHIETNHLFCKWLVSIWNATIGWNGLSNHGPIWDFMQLEYGAPGNDVKVV